MNKIPFPPTLADMSAKAAFEEYKRGLGASTRSTKRPASGFDTNMAAYRLADGKVREVYDPYNATALCRDGEGPVEFGLATVRFNLKHYANDTSGYERHVTDFKPMSELEAEGLEIDTTAVAAIADGDSIALVFGADEADLAEKIENAEACARPVVTICDDSIGSLTHFHYTATKFGSPECYAADSEERLVAQLKKRFDFIELPDDAESVFAAIEERGRKNGWSIARATRDAEPASEPSM